MDNDEFRQEEYVPVTAGLKEVPDLPEIFARMFNHDQVTRTPLDLDFDDQAFYLDGILNEEECNALIGIGERFGYGPVESDCKKECTARKVMIQSKALSDLLFNRMAPFIKDIEIKPDVTIHKTHLEGNSFAMQGIWSPIKLDIVFRLSRYTEGGFFRPHFDGFYADPENPTSIRTMKSLVFYLNSPAEGCGGETVFLSETEKDSNGNPMVLKTVNPKPGRVLIFNHRSLHESIPTIDSVKYIIRSDIMFHRTTTGQLNEKDLEAIDLLTKAEQFEMENKAMEAVNLYRRAFKLSPLLAENYQNRDSS